MTVGPLVMAAGALMLAGVDADASYWTDVLPGLVVFGLGLALMVAPADRDRAGRGAGPARRHRQRRQQRGGPGGRAAGRGRPAAGRRARPARSTPTRSRSSAGYDQAMVICAAMLAVGGLLSWVLIRNPRPQELVDAQARSAT